MYMFLWSRIINKASKTFAAVNDRYQVSIKVRPHLSVMPLDEVFAEALGEPVHFRATSLGLALARNYIIAWLATLYIGVQHRG